MDTTQHQHQRRRQEQLEQRAQPLSAEELARFVVQVQADFVTMQGGGGLGGEGRAAMAAADERLCALHRLPQCREVYLHILLHGAGSPGCTEALALHALQSLTRNLSKAKDDVPDMGHILFPLCLRFADHSVLRRHSCQLFAAYLLRRTALCLGRRQSAWRDQAAAQRPAGLAAAASASAAGAGPAATATGNLVGEVAEAVHRYCAALEPTASGLLSALILQSLAEEMGGRSLSLRPELRQAVRRCLVDAAREFPLVGFLGGFLGTSPAVALACFAALEAWAAEGMLAWASLAPVMPAVFGGVRAFPGQLTSAHALIHASLEAYGSEGLAVAAIAGEVVLLCQESAAAGVEDAEPVLGLLISAAAACWRSIGHAPTGQVLLELLPILARCVASPSVRIASDSLQFWHGLCDNPAARAQKAELAPVWRAVVERAVHRTTFPPDYMQMSLEQRDDLDAFRRDVRLFLREVCTSHAGLDAWLLGEAIACFDAAPAPAPSPLSPSPSPPPPSHSPAAVAGTPPSLSPLLPAAAAPPGGLARGWPRLEAVLHALCATAKRSTYLERPDLLSMQARLIEACEGAPAIPGLQRTLMVLLGKLAFWLGREGHAGSVPLAYRLAVKSLAIAEESEPLSMRSQADHVGCVALVKLTLRVPCGDGLSRMLLERYVEHLELGGASTLTARSQSLLLQASCQACNAMADAEAQAQVITDMVALQLHRVRQGLETSLAVVSASLESLSVVAEKLTGAGAGVAARLLAPHCTEAGAIRRLLLQCAQVESVVRQLFSTCDHLCGHPVFAPLACDMFVSLFEVRQWHYSLHLLQRCLEHFAGSEELLARVSHVLQLLHFEAILHADDPRVGTALFTLLRAMVHHVPQTLAASLPAVVVPVAKALLTKSPILEDRLAGRALLEFIAACCGGGAGGGGGGLGGGVGGVGGVGGGGPSVLHVAFRGWLAEEPAAGPLLVAGLLTAVHGTLPRHMLDEVVATLRTLLAAFGIEALQGWTAAALSDPAFVRHTVSDKAKATFVRQLGDYAARRQWPKWKNCIKQFCGGKKKTPPAPVMA